MAKEAQIVELKDSENWAMLFLKRNGSSLRRTTSVTTLTDDQLIQHAVDYIKHLQMIFFLLSTENHYLRFLYSFLHRVILNT